MRVRATNRIIRRRASAPANPRKSRPYRRAPRSLPANDSGEDERWRPWPFGGVGDCVMVVTVQGALGALPDASVWDVAVVCAASSDRSLEPASALSPPASSAAGRTGAAVGRSLDEKGAAFFPLPGDPTDRAAAPPNGRAPRAPHAEVSSAEQMSNKMR